MINYSYGDPKYKPDVLYQLEELKIQRQILLDKDNENKMKSGITVQKPGEEPVFLSHDDIVKLLQDQQNEINFLKDKIAFLESCR